jgi:hypothetical protein
MEAWKPVPGYEGAYEVSDAGQVRSLDRLDARGRRRTGKQLSLRKQPSGHLTVSLCLDRLPRSFQVHHLVLMAFVGPRPEGMEGCHYDDNPSNNHLDNLRWDTRSANQLDSVRNGTHHMAARTHCPKGHEYTAGNTYLYPTNRRACRECRRAYREERAQERRAKGREYMRGKRAAGKTSTTGKAA